MQAHTQTEKERRKGQRVMLFGGSQTQFKSEAAWTQLRCTFGMLPYTEHLTTESPSIRFQSTFAFPPCCPVPTIPHCSMSDQVFLLNTLTDTVTSGPLRL